MTTEQEILLLLCNFSPPSSWKETLDAAFLSRAREMLLLRYTFWTDNNKKSNNENVDVTCEPDKWNYGFCYRNGYEILRKLSYRIS